MITVAPLCMHTAFHLPMGHLIRLEKQIGPQAQISVSPDAGLALGHNLHLARH
jgi:hypothetical protein